MKIHPTSLPPSSEPGRKSTLHPDEPEDYACFIDALVELYQATAEPRWIRSTIPLAEKMLAHFAAPEGGFYSTSHEHAHLIARSKDRYDGSTPSGNAMAATVLLRLGRLTDRRFLQEAGEKTLRAFSSTLVDSAGGSSQMLAALDFHFGPVREIVVIGNADMDETRQVVNALRRAYLPNALILHHDPIRGEAPTDLLPLFRDKSAGATVRTYICENMTCLAPLEGPEAVANWLVER